MWICHNQAFLSVIQPAANDPQATGDVLLVRARVAGHIQAVFGSTVEVLRKPGRDYLYRAYIPRQTVAKVLMAQVMGIDYGNFKNSVRDRELHDAYASVWAVMSDLQYVKPYGNDSDPALLRERKRAIKHGYNAAELGL